MNEADHASMVTHSGDSLRLMVVAETTLQRAGLSALLMPLAQQHPIAARSFDVLRNIGASTGNERRIAAAAHARDIDVVIVVLDDTSIAIEEASVTEGITELAQLGVPVMLLLADSDNVAAQASEWLSRSVRAIVPLDAPLDELLATVRAVFAGLTVIEPGVAIEIARRSVRPRKNARQPALASGATPSLTVREREVLTLLADGHATKTIARDLGISAHTVKAHVESIFSKLGATTRAEAVAIGVRRGAVML